jgi:PhoPQ-activated pathogenicity-related protein
MIGTKKLSTIRRELEEALISPAGDPIQSLEQHIASATRKGDRTEVMESLKRFLESPRKRKRRKPRAGANAEKGQA